MGGKARASHTPILPVDVSGFRRALLRWYDTKRRALPWRESRDPYRIWISEIMLQQTRVAAVIPYYERFLGRFPDVRSLARAHEPAVLAAWSGLGYYRRARHLHAAARMIARGEFPRTSDALRELPGIGRYTAAAIASIAFGERCAVVDGNVERVLSRVCARALNGDSWPIAESLVSRTRPGDFNQAMMELGATICTPKAPQCGACPVSRFCGTRGEHPVSKPVPRKRATLTYALCVRGDRVLLVQRSKEAGLMPGMWELPQVPSRVSTTMRLRHSILNTDYEVTIVRSAGAENKAGKWVPISRAREMPLTGLARKILRTAELL